MSQDSPQTNRRSFLKNTTATAAGAVAISSFPHIARSKPNSGQLRLGFIGCGGRGTGAASQALKADSNIVLHAVGDVFQSQIDRSMKNVTKAVGDDSKFDVPKERQFVGLDAYEKVINSDVDVVILTTPPGFRPQHFKAAVAANKHIFLEKPMATDVPGIRSVMEDVEIAKEKKLAVVAGFCWRYDYQRRELFRRIHQGDIGEVRSMYATYLTGPVKPMPPKDSRPEGMSDAEWQIRNWYNFVWSGGDGLVEQAIHSVDKLMWAMKDAPPTSCTALGGRMVPNNEGNIYDHVEVNYLWPNGIRGFMAQRQIKGCHGENSDYISGTEGNAYIKGGKVYITNLKGERVWRYEGNKPNMYQVEHDELFASIRANNPLNDGVRMCTSTLAGIMGRMAGYTGKELSWDQVMNSKKKLVPENLAWDSKLPIEPMAQPGKTPFE